MKIFAKSKLAVCLSIILLVTLAIYVLIPGASFAANTHVLDLESSSSQYASISDANQTGLDLNSDFTIEGWIKPESITGNHYIFSKWSGTDSNLSYIIGLNSSGDFHIRIRKDTNTDLLSNTVDANFVTGIWQHFAVTFTVSSGVAEVFKNGVSQGTVTGLTGGPIQTGTAMVEIGSVQGGTDAFFDGLIDDLRVWNDIRTSTEILDNMNLELSGTEANLQANWRFNNDYTDQDSNNNNLTASGSPTFSTSVPFFSLLSPVYKSADESVTSSTTLQNDDHISVPLGANSTYVIEGAIFASSSSDTPDVKIAFTVPASATMDVSYISSRGSTFNHGELLESSGAASITIPVDNSNVTVVFVRGTIKTSSTAGDVKLQWAQATSNATATTVKQGSYLQVNEL